MNIGLTLKLGFLPAVGCVCCATGAAATAAAAAYIQTNNIKQGN